MDNSTDTEIIAPTNSYLVRDVDLDEKYAASIKAASQEEAAEQYASRLDPSDYSDFVDLMVDECLHTVVVPTPEPECSDSDGHDWQDSGVVGNGGGVICSYTCSRCELEMAEDTWAQDPSTGVQGYHTKKYTMAEA